MTNFILPKILNQNVLKSHNVVNNSYKLLKNLEKKDLKNGICEVDINGKLTGKIRLCVNKDKYINIPVETTAYFTRYSILNYKDKDHHRNYRKPSNELSKGDREAILNAALFLSSMNYNDYRLLQDYKDTQFSHNNSNTKYETDKFNKTLYKKHGYILREHQITENYQNALEQLMSKNKSAYQLVKKFSSNTDCKDDTLLAILYSYMKRKENGKLKRL